VAADVSTLISLWHGDEDTYGYWHEEIGVAVCEQTLPIAEIQLVKRFYPNVVVENVNGANLWQGVPKDALMMLLNAYKIWKHRRILRNKTGSAKEAAA
jgi:hypothetical protein